MILLCLISGACVVSFFLSVVIIFKKHNGEEPKRYLAIKILSPISWVIYFYKVSQVSGVGMLETAVIYCHIGSLLVFYSAYWSIKQEKFTLIFSADIPRQIVQTGLYRFIRHPFYTSYIIFYVGCAILIRDLLLIVPHVALIGIYIYASYFEETKILNSAMSETYKQYANKAGRFIPKIF